MQNKKQGRNLYNMCAIIMREMSRGGLFKKKYSRLSTVHIAGIVLQGNAAFM